MEEFERRIKNAIKYFEGKIAEQDYYENRGIDTTLDRSFCLGSIHGLMESIKISREVGK